MMYRINQPRNYPKMAHEIHIESNNQLMSVVTSMKYRIKIERLRIMLNKFRTAIKDDR